MMTQILEKRNALKRKLNQRQLVCGGWVSFGHPGPSEIFTQAGFDFIGIDIEHSTISQEQSQRIIAACQSAGVCCLPRIASHNPEMARRLLDSGADGIIVPMVSNAVQVNDIMSWVKYPPLGKRGFGVGRAQGYGFDFAEYTKTWNESSIIIAQIESIDAVNDIEQILNNPHLDGVMVGPYDISGSLNVPGQLDHPQVVDAGLRVVNACREKGKSCAAHVIEPSLDQMRHVIGKGYTFLILSSDLFVLSQWARQMGQNIRAL